MPSAPRPRPQLSQNASYHLHQLKRSHMSKSYLHLILHTEGPSDFDELIAKDRRICLLQWCLGCRLFGEVAMRVAQASIELVYLSLTLCCVYNPKSRRY